MRILLLAVGRLRAGPERELVDTYLSRFERTGRAVGLKAVEEIQLPDTGGREAEGQRLLAKVPADGMAFRLDEAGEPLTSMDFSQRLQTWRDTGVPTLTFLIGGAEGFSRDVRNKVPQTISFGVQTWPHKLVRVMLAEQLYRASTLIAGLPYHKA